MSSSRHHDLGSIRSPTKSGEKRHVGKAERIVSILKNLFLAPFIIAFGKIFEMKEFFANQLPMLQYLWPKDSLRLRIFLVISMVFMFMGKWLNVKVPFMLQRAIDAVSASVAKGAVSSGTAAVAGAGAASQTSVARSLGLLVGGSTGAAAALALYGAARAMSVVCAEAKTCLFTHVSQNVLRKFASNIFSHLHSLNSDFHLETPSGVISVAYVRAVRGFQTMLFQIVFSVAPTLLELAMVSNVLYRRCGPVFTGVTLLTFMAYLLFTVWITQWRINIRKELVDVDNTRNGFFIDSILNHEVVKYFTNERRETERYDRYLTRIQELSIEATYAIAVLNLGQAALFCAGLTTSLLIALHKVNKGLMSVGDLVAVNSMLLQLSIPFNFMGYTYQELRQSFVDMSFMRDVLMNVKPTVMNNPDAPDIEVAAPRNGPSQIEFR
jgi:ABC-type multidrug transport system fused ATPase/permease subunit